MNATIETTFAGVMLAETYSPAVNPAGWWVSEKLDGVRAYWTGRELLTRNGNVICAPGWFTASLPDFALDGELWIGRGQFQRVSAIVRRRTPDDAWRSITFQVFDAPEAPGGFERRMETLTAWAATAPEWIAVVVQQRCVDAADLNERLSAIESVGGEGLMLRAADSPYDTGRSADLLKVKRISDADAVVVGYAPGRGKHAGRIGALLVRTDAGIEFELGTGLRDDERDSPPTIGARVIFRYSGLTDSAVPRFARFVGVRAD